MVAIIEVALDILAEEGDQGLSMRKVATLANMSLSNVQYYFKTKEELLKALLQHYLEVTTQAYERFIVDIPETERIQETIKYLLIHPDTSYVCSVYKELWAISERNEVIKQHLDEHYQIYAEVIRAELQSTVESSCSEKSLDQAVSLLLTSIEGFAITQNAIPCDADALAELLTKTVSKMIQ